MEEYIFDGKNKCITAEDHSAHGEFPESLHVKAKKWDSKEKISH